LGATLYIVSGGALNSTHSLTFAFVLFGLVFFNFTLVFFLTFLGVRNIRHSILEVLLYDGETELINKCAIFSVLNFLVNLVLMGKNCNTLTTDFFCFSPCALLEDILLMLFCIIYLII